MTIETRMNKLEDRVKRVLRLLSAINSKYQSIVQTRKHYLRHRAPGVFKRQQMLVKAAAKMADKLKMVQRLNIHTTAKSRTNKQHNILLLVTPNQARKLKAIADSSLIGFLNSKENRDSKNRVVLNYTKRKSATWSSRLADGMSPRHETK